MISSWKSYFFILLTYLSSNIYSQYPENSGLYNETIDKGEKVLRDFIESDPDVEYILYPERRMIDTDQYHFIEPQNEDYTIGIIIDPVSFFLIDFFLLLSNFDENSVVD